MKRGRRTLVRSAIAALLAGLAALVTLLPGSAHAASEFANKDGWDKSGKCDAIVGVSDETTNGTVEVYGGFSCPTGTGLWNQPEKATIRVRIFQNGKEIIQSKKTLKDCQHLKAKVTCSSDHHEITYPDYAGTDKFHGQMEIVSFGGTVTLTTPTIKT
jgi:hypothetical protein